MEHAELTEKIIGAAYEVYNTLGPGFLESVYEKSLLIELRRVELHAIAQLPLAVRYKEELVGDFVADLLVEGKVLVELKAVRTITAAHEVQLVNYLTATGIEVGLLVNFGESKVEIKRKTRTLVRSESPSHPVHPVNPV